MEPSQGWFLDTANGVLMFYLAYSATNANQFATVLNYIGLVLMVIGAVLSVFSCVNYSKNAVVSLTAGSNKEKAVSESVAASISEEKKDEIVSISEEIVKNEEEEEDEE